MHSFILAAREREKHSACCVRNDRSGCVQTSKEECSVGFLCCPLLLPDSGPTVLFTLLLAVCGTLTRLLSSSHLTQFLWKMLI